MLVGTAFTSAAPFLVSRGYSPLPIAPGTKAPGTYWLRDGWQPMRRWDNWCKKLPPPNVIQGWSKWPNAGAGVACGMGLICIDIDLEECMTALLAILPVSNVKKKGRKGVSLFYRGNTDKIRSRNFRTIDKVGLVDLLSEGKQTVLPPSIHPDTGEPYYWLTEETLLNTWPEDLTELPDDIGEQIGEVLKAFGYDPLGERERGVKVARTNTPACASSGGSDAASLFREVNDLALANLSAWVPKLGLQRCYRSGSGFKAVAEWRSSGSGRPLARRSPNLSFVSQGICDFGTGEKFTPIDVVMTAHRVSASEALDWLGALVSQSWREPLIVLTSRKTT